MAAAAAASWRWQCCGFSKTLPRRYRLMVEPHLHDAAVWR
jgi:hypothetical protein